jgi:hypothetical protein
MMTTIIRDFPELPHKRVIPTAAEILALPEGHDKATRDLADRIGSWFDHELGTAAKRITEEGIARNQLFPLHQEGFITNHDRDAATIAAIKQETELLLRSKYEHALGFLLTVQWIERVESANPRASGWILRASLALPPGGAGTG